MLNTNQMLIIEKSIRLRLSRGEDVVEIFKGYKNLTDEEKTELLSRFSLTPYEPTLEELKGEKIAELSATCKQKIEEGVSIEINGIEEHFTYGVENGDQGNIDNIFQLANTTKLDQPYHCTDGSCKLYTPEQITELYIKEKMNVTVHQTYFNQLKNMIKNEFTTDEDKETVKSICYGYELSGSYLENYNNIMEQSKLIINSLISSSDDAAAQ